MQENTYKHLNEDCQAIIKTSKEKRINYMLDEVVIEYPAVKKVHNILEDLMNRPKKARMQNLLIIGESNMGKTSIAKSFDLKHKSYTIENEDTMSVIVRPVLYTEALNRAEEKDLYIAILDSGFQLSVGRTDRFPINPVKIVLFIYFCC